MNNIDLTKITRLEIINHTNCETCKGAGRVKIEGTTTVLECPECHGSGMTGRQVVFHNPDKEVKLSLQDDGRTLKLFVTKRKL